jgi:hypothetical protein
MIIFMQPTWTAVGFVASTKAYRKAHMFPTPVKFLSSKPWKLFWHYTQRHVFWDPILLPPTSSYRQQHSTLNLQMHPSPHTTYASTPAYSPAKQHVLASTNYLATTTPPMTNICMTRKSVQFVRLKDQSIAQGCMPGYALPLPFRPLPFFSIQSITPFCNHSRHATCQTHGFETRSRWVTNADMTQGPSGM